MADLTSITTVFISVLSGIFTALFLYKFIFKTNLEDLGRREEELKAINWKLSDSYRAEIGELKYLYTNLENKLNSVIIKIENIEENIQADRNQRLQELKITNNKLMELLNYLDSRIDEDKKIK